MIHRFFDDYNFTKNLFLRLSQKICWWTIGIYDDLWVFDENKVLTNKSIPFHWEVDLQDALSEVAWEER